MIWAAPLLIVICAPGASWTGTHLLDPFRPLAQVGEQRPVPEHVEPLEIQAVAMDWKWLFIYPEQGFATVNEVAVPVDRPVRFHLTSQSVMNAFYVPATAGMIYAMPGMESQLNAVMNVPGDYEGFSANYSGAGFSRMRFRLHGFETGDFDRWVADRRGGGARLDRASYLDLAHPSENVAPMHYGSVVPDMFGRILNRCVEEGRLCINQMMLDAGAGPGGPDAEPHPRRRSRRAQRLQTLLRGRVLHARRVDRGLQPDTVVPPQDPAGVARCRRRRVARRNPRPLEESDGH